MMVASAVFFFLHNMVVNCCSLFSAAAAMCMAQLILLVRGFCGWGVAGVGVWVLGFPFSGFLPVGWWGPGVEECCWHIRWSSAVIEATCFSSSHIQLVLVACAESSAFSICSTCRESCRMSCQSESVSAMPKAGFLAVVSAGGTEGHLCTPPVKAGISRLVKSEGPGAGVDRWEVGGGEPMLSELFTPKESRVR
jgi:hypothetical protein